MKSLVFFFLFIQNALALEAVITVLETPLFKSPNRDAQVVQYLRKGDVITIHPSVANTREMDEYSPPPKKLKEANEKIRLEDQYNQDPLFRGEETKTYSLEDEFIATTDRRGQKAFVLSEHLYVFFGDQREFTQGMISKDPTDYRLEEPLPKKYPLKTPVGLRGLFLMGFTQPYNESYPYLDKVKRKGYSSPIDLNVTFLKLMPGNFQNRFFVGAGLNYKHFENSYTFQSRRFSQEKGNRFGFGPTASYDAFKGEKNRVNISGTLLFNLIDRINIVQSLDKTTSESRLYTAYSIAPRLSIQYHRKQILEDLDFVLGTSLEVGLPTTYSAKNGAGESGWWRNLGADEFSTRTNYSLGAYLGLQSAY